MNFNFKPVPYLEIGLERTAMFGGKGRSESLSTWWHSFIGKGENVDNPDPKEAGDQKAGVYAKVTLPFKSQPVQLYVEADGEDQRNSLPSKWAYVTGIYLPRLAGLDRVELRGEFAYNHDGTHPNVWYNHHIYTQGYTYRGRVIGHYMGTDSQDIFVQASYLLPKARGRVSVSYDRVEHNLSGAIRENKDEFILKTRFNVRKDLEIRALYGYGRVRNPGNVAGDPRSINIVEGELLYRF
jgi:hypothetical protein